MHVPVCVRVSIEPRAEEAPRTLTRLLSACAAAAAAGAGKSTLMLAIMRLVEPCGGSVEIDGVDVCNISLRLLRQRVCVISQARAATRLLPSRRSRHTCTPPHARRTPVLRGHPAPQPGPPGRAHGRGADGRPEAGARARGELRAR